METLADPIQVFASLTKSPTCLFRDLWDIEKEVLTLYYAELKDKERVGFQLPTGSGKTVIGLLIAEAWRRSGKKVVVLTANYYLCHELQKKGLELGIPCEVIGREANNPTEYRRVVQLYRDGKCLGIMNYWAYLFSKFELPDILIVDDAHEFVGVIEDHYTISIHNSGDTKSLYREVCRDLPRFSYPSVEKFYFNQPSSYDDVELLYFNHSDEVIAKLKIQLPALKAAEDASDDLSNVDRAQFSYNRNRDIIDYLLTFVSLDKISVCPYIVPIEISPKIKDVNHIIYMSATLGSKDTIQMALRSSKHIHLVTAEDLKSKVKTMGKRLILPLENTDTSSKIHEKTLMIVENICKLAPKSLIMCRSYSESHLIENHLKEKGFKNVQVFTEDRDVDDFKKSSEGVLVTAWRFIGLDFPGDTCRLAILVSVPHVVGPIDAFNKTVIEEEGFSTEKVANRLIQAFGRCNRSFFDYAVYYVVDERFIKDISIHDRVFPNFPTQIRAEIKYGLEVCNGELDKSLDFGRLFLDEGIRDFEENVGEIATKLPGEKAVLPIPPNCVKEIVSWEKLLTGDIEGAAESFEEYANSLSKNESFVKIAAWNYYMAAHCHYLMWTKFQIEDSRAKTLDLLTSAANLGNNSWFNKLRMTRKIISGERVVRTELTLLDRLREKVCRNMIEFINNNSTAKMTIERKWEDYKKTIFSGTHAEVCTTLGEIFELIGFEVQLKYKEHDEPDIVLYPFSDEKYVALIEVKTTQQGVSIGSSDVGQILKHVGKYERSNPSHKVYPVIFTNKKNIIGEALEASINKVRILMAENFGPFMIGYLKVLREIAEVKSPLEKVAAMMKIPPHDNFIALFEPKQNPIVLEEECQSIFP